MSRRSSRGFMIIVALLILLICLVMGMGLLSSQEARYRGSRRVLESYQALELARAGLEDARIKLERDLEFPNPSKAPQTANEQEDDQQTVFTYGEDLETLEGLKGSYFVTVDRTFNRHPYHTLVVTSTGTLGPKSNPLAQRKLRCEYCRKIPADGVVGTQSVPPPLDSAGHPNPYQFVRLEDFGSL